jgi:membrane protease YdiL (CAAX protease family)
VLKVWRILYPVLIEFALSSVVANLAVAAIMVYMGSGGDYLGAYDRNYILIMGITDLLLIPIFAYMMQKDETRRIADGRMDLILRENHINVLQFLLVVIFSICASSVINMLTGWIPTDPSAYEDLQESITSSSVTIQFLVVCITGPFAEEVLFRGVIYRRLRDYTGTAWAAVLSGVIFGFVHMNLLQGVYAALFGVALALLYEHYGTIWASIIAHVANNFYATFGNLALSRLDSFGGSVFSAACIALTFLIGWYIFAYDSKANVV